MITRAPSKASSATGPFLQLQPQQEVAGEVDAAEGDVTGARGGQIEQAERDGHAAPPLADAEHVHVVEVVVVQHLAGEAQVAGQGAGDGVVEVLGLQPPLQARDRLLQHGAGRGGRATACVVERAGDGGLEQREGVVGRLAGLGQNDARIDALQGRARR
jgi:hypothetical protein